MHVRTRAQTKRQSVISVAAEQSTESVLELLKLHNILSVPVRRAGARRSQRLAPRAIDEMGSMVRNLCVRNRAGETPKGLGGGEARTLPFHGHCEHLGHCHRRGL
jgi:hypothetical protein